MASDYVAENGTARKRARSRSDEMESTPEGTEQIPKKTSKSELPTSNMNIDRIALLDAGAQYGKVGDTSE